MFQTTLWSKIEQAQGGASQAVRSFVESYRPPLLRFIISKGYGHDEAEDLTQEVFLRLFTRDALARADQQRGRFRAFLRGIAWNVIREDRERRGAAKRGGDRSFVPLEESSEPAARDDDDDDTFDVIWSEHLLEGALVRLAREHPVQHRALRLRFVEGRSYEEIGRLTDRTVAQVRNDIHRGRARVVRAIKLEVAGYSSSSDEYRGELAAFAAFLGRHEARSPERPEA